MPWLDSHSDANKIIDAEERIPIRFFGIDTSLERTEEVSHFRYVGMTYEAAVTCRDALHEPARTPPRHAELVRENNAGAYTVKVTEVTYSDWRDIGGES